MIQFNKTSPGNQQMLVHSSWEAVTTRYKLLGFVDQGSFGMVIKAVNLENQLLYAIKQVKVQKEAQADIIRKEIEIMKRLTNMKDNIYTTTLTEVIQWEGTHSNDTSRYLFLVMPLIPSNLKRLLDQTARIEFTEGHVTTILYNLLCSVNFVHSTGLIHRDIKPANVLIDDKCRVYLCDFGLSTPSSQEQHELMTMFLKRETSTNSFQEGHEQTSPISLNGSGTILTENSMVRLQSRGSTQSTSSAEIFSSFSSNGGTPCNNIRSPDRQSQDDSKKNIENFKKQRKMSPHVCSRWYRPPEVILLNPKYDAKIDIWSVGCILAEMLLCLQLKRIGAGGASVSNNSGQNQSAKTAFRGAHCHPLSPRRQQSLSKTSEKLKNNIGIANNLDQIQTILLGLPSLKQSDVTFLEDYSAILYLKQQIQQTQQIALMTSKEQVLNGALFSQLSGISEDFLDLLKQMLEFNPKNRPTAFQCTQHRVFDKIRMTKYEAGAKQKLF